jgi:hypothetical protein
VKLNNALKGVLALTATLSVSLGAGNAAHAAPANTTQLYRCSSGTGSIFFQQVNGQSKQFAYGTTSKIAAISPNAAGGTLGVVVTPPSQTFNSIYWYANPLNSHTSLQSLNVILCFNNPNGTFFSSIVVPSNATVTSPAGQGWYLVRPSLPSDLIGKVLTQVTFQYSGSTTLPINLGKVAVNNHGIGTTLNTALLGCQAESCP